MTNQQKIDSLRETGVFICIDCDTPTRDGEIFCDSHLQEHQDGDDSQCPS